MNNDFMDNKLISKRKIIGRILSLYPIFVNLLAVVALPCSLEFAAIFNCNVSFLTVLFFSLIFPVMAFVFSVIIRKILFEDFPPLWIVGYIINLVLYIFYLLGASVFGFAYLCFSDFSSLFG
ncbi:MAG: hypothetical protein IKZ76_02315 [Lachnospiraceae bacterium]|nr:hypothetical protein [Lachnospiraceae bacterium]